MPIKSERSFEVPESRHFIQEWRLFRGLTQEQVATRIEYSVPQISKIERSKQGYRKQTLELFAYALGCEPADLLRPPPDAREAEIIDLLKHLKGPKRDAAVAMLRGLLKAGEA